MAYTTYTNITKAGGLVPTEYTKQVLAMLPEQSACVRAFRTINMGAHTTVLPVLTGLATAAFISEGSAITASTNTWTGKNLVAEKVAAIVPISKEVWNDSTFDLGPEVMKSIVNAIAGAIDAAVILETSKPTSWTASGLLSACTVGSSTVSLATQVSASATMAETISAVMALPEADGYVVNGFIAHPIMKAKLRSAKDTYGQPIYQPMTGGFPANLYGENITFCNNGGMNSASSLLIAGDMSAGVIGLREDMTVELLREATITVGGDAISLAQNDMVALKFIFRCGYQLANWATGLNSSTQIPFGMLIA